MAKHHKITANGAVFGAETGAVLLDSALLQGVEIPHDCRAGRCGTCLTRVRKGVTVGGETANDQLVYACQAHVLSDLEVEFEALPPPQRVEARIVKLTELSVEVVELKIRPAKELAMRPGQYCQFQFRGLPARCFSPTVPLRRATDHGAFRLQIKRVRNGRVSSQLGATIKTGHRLTIEGPFGSAFHRPGRGERLVLASSGTGFAPILAVADAALRENHEREIVLIAGARRLDQLYMPAALGRLSAAPNVTVIATADEPQSTSRVVRQGPVAAHMPELRPNDIVYVAGGRSVVESVSALAKAVGAELYLDAFDVNPGEGAAAERPSLWSRMSERLSMPAWASPG